MNKEILKKLILSLSPSGFEDEAVNIFDSEVSKIPGVRHYYRDKIGNSAWAIGEGSIKVLISGHIDAISARIQNITEDGIMSLVNVGGMDRKALIGSEVIVLGNKGPIKGVIEKIPIHIEYFEDDENNKIGPFSDLRLDIGAENKDQVLEQGITPGCPIVHARCFDLEFGPAQRVRGNELDDKLGVFTSIETFRRLAEEGFPEKYTIICLATTQEETGLRGSTVATKNINPDISIDFDTLPATDGDLNIKKDAHGDIKLGKGAVISWGPEKSARLCRALNEIANKNEIKVQNETTSSGGTNTSRFQLFSDDCECALISFPLRNLHTPVETADWKDIEGSIELLTKTIQDGTIF